MHHLKGDALLFCFTYGIESLRVCGWSYECDSLHIEPPPPPRKDGYYKHIEADNLLTQHSWQSMLRFTSLQTSILMCSQDAKSC